MGAIFGTLWSGTKTVTNCFTSSSLPISGNQSFTGSNNYALVADTSGTTVLSSANDMKGSAAAENMPGLDFEFIWKTVENDYPIIRDDAVIYGTFAKADSFAGGTGTANDPYVIGLEGTNFFYELLESFNGGNVCQYVLKGSHDFLDVRNSFNLLSDGVSFFVTKLPNGKYALKLSGSIVSGKTRAELMDYLADNITSVNWRKYQTKLFTRGGLGFSEKEFGSAFKNIKYGPLNEYLNFATKGGTEAFSQLKVTGNIVKDTWSANWGDHIKNITEFSDASNVDKVIKGLGIAGDVLTIGTNVKENMFDKDGHVVINTHSLVETVGDIGFDMAADAGGAAAGAAVGSFFAPPLGTVVGAGVGLLISCAGNIDVYDVDKDGEKDSIMDMGHKAIDKVCDFFWGED